jgi:hypothetical protein
MLGLRHTRRLMQLAVSDPYQAQTGIFEDRPQFDRNTLHLNRGDGTYADIACYSGLEASDWTWSAILLDVDLDGYEDLCRPGTCSILRTLMPKRGSAKVRRRDWIPQKLLMFPKCCNQGRIRNRGSLTFEEVGRIGPRQAGVGHGMAVVDLDNGDLVWS